MIIFLNIVEKIFLNIVEIIVYFKVTVIFHRFIFWFCVSFSTWMIDYRRLPQRDNLQPPINNKLIFLALNLNGWCFIGFKVYEFIFLYLSFWSFFHFWSFFIDHVLFFNLNGWCFIGFKVYEFILRFSLSFWFLIIFHWPCFVFNLNGCCFIGSICHEFYFVLPNVNILFYWWVIFNRSIVWYIIKNKLG